MARRRATLLDIERENKRRRKDPHHPGAEAMTGGGRSAVLAKSFDTGAPIALRQRHLRSSPVPPSAYLDPWVSNATGRGRYVVESFEEPTPSDPAPEGPCFSGRDASAPRPQPRDPQGTVVAQQPKASPAVARRPELAQVREAATDLLSLQASDVDDFEADIRAILGTQAGKKGAEPTPAPAAPTAPAEPGDPPGGERSESDGHAIFDRMGQSMRYANTFDLGSVELEDRFDSFERELDRAETKPAIPARVSALSLPSQLDDLEVLSDLVAMGEAQAASQPPTPSDDRALKPGGALQDVNGEITGDARKEPHRAADDPPAKRQGPSPDCVVPRGDGGSGVATASPDEEERRTAPENSDAQPESDRAATEN
jgi:hypothetical protein